VIAVLKRVATGVFWLGVIVFLVVMAIDSWRVFPGPMLAGGR